MRCAVASKTAIIPSFGHSRQFATNGDVTSVDQTCSVLSSLIRRRCDQTSTLSLLQHLSTCGRGKLNRETQQFANLPAMYRRSIWHATPQFFVPRDEVVWTILLKLHAMAMLLLPL